MSVNYSIEALLKQSDKFLGETVSIDAVLVIKNTEAYLVASTDATESVDRIPIHCPGLELQLDLTVGGWMGSAYSYLDAVKVTGKLEAGTTRKNKLALTEIAELTLTRDDESFPVIQL